MSLRRFVLVAPFRVALVLAASIAAWAPISAQSPARPQPYCIRGVSLDRAGEHKGTLILRDGAIAAVLDESAPVPPGARVLEGAGLICLPAFLDAYSRHGCTVPLPVKDQDLPPNELADVGVDMRLANRKGIQPGFRAVEALALTKEEGEVWRKQGFGALLVSPGGELLSGSSALATTREAAMRDLVLRDEVFEHAAFAASGQGYPSTLMGYFAQLRQFLLDSQHQVELEQRYQQGRPGLRPPFDAQLAAGAALVSRERTLVCEANDSDDIQRWLRLADEFSLKVDFAGGLEAWKVREVLKERGATVVLTLDWGKEVKDPLTKTAKEAPKEAKAEKTEGQGEGAAPAAPETAAAPAAAPAGPAVANAATYEYEEPLAVRVERRKKWEEGRDCALRLHEAGVRFAFGTASGKPSELLEHVRTLVKDGLPAESALAALTSDAAEFLGVGARLGRIAVGQDATFTLWRSDPLVDEKASPAWTFVDGFPSEFKEPKKKEKKAGAPGEGIDPTGSWTLAFDGDGEGIKEAKLVLKMETDGSVTGTISFDNPMGGARVESEVEGTVSADKLELTCTIHLGPMTLESTITATIDGDELDGESSVQAPDDDEPTKQSFRGKKTP